MQFILKTSTLEHLMFIDFLTLERKMLHLLFILSQVVLLGSNGVNDPCLKGERNLNQFFERNNEYHLSEKLYGEILGLINEYDLEALNNNKIKQLNCTIFEDSYSYYWISSLSKIFY
jgi:hypothetical protein